MIKTSMTDTEWALAEGLARALAGRRVSHNLVRQATNYSAQYPGSAALQDWLERLTTLGATFASGREDTTRRERENLSEVLLPQIQSHPGQDWVPILAWTARLMLYFARSGPSKTAYRGRR